MWHWDPGIMISHLPTQAGLTAPQFLGFHGTVQIDTGSPQPGGNRNCHRILLKTHHRRWQELIIRFVSWDLIWRSPCASQCSGRFWGSTEVWLSGAGKASGAAYLSRNDIKPISDCYCLSGEVRMTMENRKDVLLHSYFSLWTLHGAWHRRSPKVYLLQSTPVWQG